MDVAYRLLRADDSIEELTELIHRAYASLAAMGLRYLGTWQPPETTRERAEGGECWVAEVDGQVVGTIAFQPPGRSGGCPWYERPDVATFGQFAVEPSLQGSGVGSALLTLVEARALELGAAEIACDTAEPATHLIRWYEARGYRIVDRVDWRPGTNYLSVVLSKRLA